MDYLYLTLSVFGSASSSIFGTFYNQKNEGQKSASIIFSLLQVLTSLAFWMIMYFFERVFRWEILLYAFPFGVAFAGAVIATIYAVKTGPIVLTSLILQMSLIAVTIWGFFFWNTELTWLVGLGLFLIFVSLFLSLYTGKKEKNKINLRWGLWVSLLFICNAACSILSRTQQIQYEGKYRGFFMMTAMIVAVVICSIFYLKSDRKDSSLIVKKSWYFPVAAGGCNGIMNLCIMALAVSSLSPNLIYPVSAVGSLAVTTAFSALFLKEKMHWWQWIGIVIGAIAVAILSI